MDQQAWIFNGTVKENILFGLPFDKAKYNTTIKACCFERDLQLFSGGDLTEIGQNGVNLSGGQKARLSLCRAVYSDADIYLLDDPLAALDATVAKKIYQNCIRGVLKHKTVVMVTNQVQFAEQADQIIVIDNGCIIEQGSQTNLVKQNGLFAQLLEEYTMNDKNDDTVDDEDEMVILKRQSSTDQPNKTERKDKFVGLIQKEDRETGMVKAQVVFTYTKMVGGIFFFTCVLILFIAAQVCMVGSNIWLGVWSSGSDSQGVGFFLAIYAAWSFANIVIQLFAQFALVFAGLRASHVSHSQMFQSILHAPTSFFNVTPIGRIMNRFSNDQRSIDNDLPSGLATFLRVTISFIAVIGVIAGSVPESLGTYVPVLWMFFFLQRYFQTTSREIKRLDSITRSPIYDHFSQCLNGVATIRAYRAQDRLSLENQNRLDNNMRVYLASITANRWLSVRLEFLGGILILCSTIFLIAARSDMSPHVAGLTLSYALQITSTLQSLVRTTSSTENTFNSVERVKHFIDIPPEGTERGKNNAPPNWPSQGIVEFKDVRMRYRDELPLILKGVSLNIGSKQKIGIVGRTGAGKSSLFVVLFRLVELSGGTILVDDIDISTLTLKSLRMGISMIPQTPVLMTGTVRFNLDPFDHHEDDVIWEALRRANIKDYIQKQPDQLEHEVAEEGSNFSVGQRQLLCLARALLERPKILVLDEATASVDVSTDRLIQNTIRNEFSDATMLIIAHRIDTIIECNYVAVMKAGDLHEWGTPNELIEDQGEFYKMIQDTGPTVARNLIKKAKASQQENLTSR